MDELTSIYDDISDACHRLAIGLGGPATASAAAVAARDLGVLFEQLADLTEESQRSETSAHPSSTTNTTTLSG